MRKPLFSAILISYNQARTIGAAAESMLLAMGSDDELICSDDGSSDDTIAILEAIARRDGRVRVLYNRHSGMPSAVRNAGLAAASGEWISFLDGDDLYASERFRVIQEVLDATAHPKDVIFHNHRVFFDGDDHMTGIPRITAELEQETFTVAAESPSQDADSRIWSLSGNRLGVFLVARRFLLQISSICVRRQLLLDRGIHFHEDRVFGEDHPFMLACVIGSRVLYVRENLSFYRKHERSLTAATDAAGHLEQLRSLREQVTLLESRAPEAMTPLERTAMRLHLLEATLHQGYLLERAGRTMRAVHVYLRASADYRSHLAWMRAAKALVRRPN